MAHKKSNVTVVLNKRHYSSEIAALDMSTAIFFTTHSIQEHDTTREVFVK